MGGKWSMRWERDSMGRGWGEGNSGGKDGGEKMG